MNGFVAVLFPIVMREGIAHGLLAEQTVFCKCFKVEMGHGDSVQDYAEKEVPQPHDLEALGLLNLNPPPTIAVT